MDKRKFVLIKFCGNEKYVAQNNKKEARNMALEERNGNYYYYKKERDGNRVVSKYYGKGELANLVAQMDEIERYEKQIEAEKQRKNREKIEEIDRKLSEIEQNLKSLTNLYLISKDFYKTSSREWRQRKQK